MGSAALLSIGLGRAAYQRTIIYTARDEPGEIGLWATLQKALVSCPSCWDINITQAAQDGPWGT